MFVETQQNHHHFLQAHHMYQPDQNKKKINENDPGQPTKNSTTIRGHFPIFEKWIMTARKQTVPG